MKRKKIFRSFSFVNKDMKREQGKLESLQIRLYKEEKYNQERTKTPRLYRRQPASIKCDINACSQKFKKSLRITQRTKIRPDIHENCNIR